MPYDALEGTYQKEFGSLGMPEDCDDEDYGDLEERGAYQEEFGSLGTSWKDWNKLEKAFSQFLGFLQYIGIYTYELGVRERNREEREAIREGFYIDYLCVFVRDGKDNLFWHCPYECEWGLGRIVKDEGTGEYEKIEVNKSAYEFLKEHYDGNSLLEELLLLFEHLHWVRPDCFMKQLQKRDDVGIGQWLEGYTFKKREVETYKTKLYKAQKGRCTGCGTTRSDKRFFDLDHIWPECVEGELVFGNVQLLCKSCNRSKKAKSWVHFVYEEENLRSDMITLFKKDGM